MDPTKWRISKACEECRVRKIRCDGGRPCQRCHARNIACEYRKKARNRLRREAATPSLLSVSQGSHVSDGEDEAGRAGGGGGGQPGSRHGHVSHESSGQGPSGNGHGGPLLPGHAARPLYDPRTRNSIHNHSVAATHRASPSVFLQLYYGPSSNFTLLNAIYHQLEGTRPSPDAAAEVEEMGPGLDLFNSRRVYFGDLGGGPAGQTGAGRAADDALPGMFLDRGAATRFLERYLATYWHVLPIWSQAEYRARLGHLYDALEIFSADNPDTVIVVLALAIGASVLEHEATAQSLFRTAKRWSASLDDMVNIQTVQIALLMSHFCAEDARPNSGFLMAGVAVRKAVAAGLHKDVTRAHSQDARQGRITVWCVFFWEIWVCFSLGRPSAFPESEIDVPFPHEEKMLQSLVTLAQLMSKCVNRIYRQHHESLLPIWNAALEIRRELRQFARQQLQDLNFGLVGDAYDGELGVCQTIVSTMYHHTLLLTFRPFLVLRAKLQQDSAAHAAGALPTPPAWLDTACEYCLDAARHTILYLSGAFEKNHLCRTIKYHVFFLEGASNVLAFYLLQDKTTGRANLPWIQMAYRALESLKPQSTSAKHDRGPGSAFDPSGNLERMIQAVFPDFQIRDMPDGSDAPGLGGAGLGGPGADTAVATDTTDTLALRPNTVPAAPVVFPSTPFGLDDSGPASTESPATSTLNPEAPTDLMAADLGWNFDFSTMNMEAFLTIDPNMSDFGYR